MQQMYYRILRSIIEPIHRAENWAFWAWCVRPHTGFLERIDNRFYSIAAFMGYNIYPHCPYTCDHCGRLAKRKDLYAHYIYHPNGWTKAVEWWCPTCH